MRSPSIPVVSPKPGRWRAIVDDTGETYNGKQIDTLHEISSSLDPETDVLTLSVDGSEERHRFDLTAERDEASEWFSEFVGERLALRRREPPAFVDRPELGPSVISTGTLEEVASWFNGVTPEGARRRLRPNVEIGGVPPFWEDRLLGEDAPSFEIDGIALEGAQACARCVVPTRDPDTGEPIEGFWEAIHRAARSDAPGMGGRKRPRPLLYRDGDIASFGDRPRQVDTRRRSGVRCRRAGRMNRAPGASEPERNSGSVFRRSVRFAGPTASTIRNTDTRGNPTGDR